MPSLAGLVVVLLVTAPAFSSAFAQGFGGPAIAQERTTPSGGGQNLGRTIYMERCFWCHGEEGKGDGPSAVGTFPRPRDFTRADYKIRSTPHGQLPTDEDLFRVIARGLPGTPMPEWETILTEEEIRSVASYIQSFSPRFESEAREPIGPPPNVEGSAERGEEVYRKARCFTCHGEAGRGDGDLTASLNFEWGYPYQARDFTRGWTFKGGHEPADIYRSITGGINGTPMGPYQDLLSEEERWDLAHYVASLDEEPMEESTDFVVAARYTGGDIPASHDAGPWEELLPVSIPLAGQVVLDPPVRWWIPTVGTAQVRALWNNEEVAFLLEWNDPTGPDDAYAMADSAFIQLATLDATKPYFLFGDKDSPVEVWHWASAGGDEEWTATGTESIEAQPARLRVSASFGDGRWHAIFRRPLSGELAPGEFVPVLFSIRDGANAERGNVRALSTWLYATLSPPLSFRPWLLALAWALGAVLVELWILARLRTP